MPHKKEKILFGAAAAVMIVLAFLVGVSVAPEHRVTVTSTVTLARTVTPGPPVITVKGQRVKINETFTVHCGLSGEAKIPVQVTFLGVRYADKVEIYKADKGYKLLVVEVSIRNVGFKEARVFDRTSLRQWTVSVDKGYTYESKNLFDLPEKVRPEEVKTGYVVFEILADTKAVEVYARVYWADVDVILQV